MYSPGQHLASHMIALYDEERRQRSELENLIRSAHPVSLSLIHI